MIDGNGLSETPTADNYETVVQSSETDYGPVYTVWSTDAQGTPQLFLECR